jgi:hypothetical protein
MTEGVSKRRRAECPSIVERASAFPLLLQSRAELMPAAASEPVIESKLNCPAFAMVDPRKGAQALH